MKLGIAVALLFGMIACKGESTPSSAAPSAPTNAPPSAPTNAPPSAPTNAAPGAPGATGSGAAPAAGSDYIPARDQKGRSRRFTAFSELASQGSWHINWKAVPGDPASRTGGTADFVGSDADVGHMVTQLVMQTLYVESDGASLGDVTANLTSPALQKIELFGSGNFTAEGLSGARLTLYSSSSGQLRMSGAVDKLEVTLAGSGQVDLSQLQVADLTLSHSGSGAVSVSAQHSAAIALSGSGEVTISGGATITETISGSGKVIRR